MPIFLIFHHQEESLNNAKEPAEIILQSILKDVEAFRDSLEQEDDVTLVIIKVIET
jgi:serine phosphatase RsbU (regulator of sigma subunit)